jgi:short-subunit dehydrogenase
MNPAAFRARFGPWAVVTGCAMGIGAAYVERLAGLGLNVVLVDREAATVHAQAERLSARVQVRECVVDLRIEADVERALDQIADLEVGLLVANAAISTTAAWLAVPLEEKLSQIRVNVVAVTQMVDRLSRAMAARGRGGIIVMSSMAGTIGSSMVATYAATKAFDLILAESLWAELGPNGVDVLAVLPGQTRTPGYTGSLTERSKVPAMVKVMEPDEVVREALDALGKRPRIVAGAQNRLAGALIQRVLPRKAAIEMMARSTRGLYPDAPSEGPRG